MNVTMAITLAHFAEPDDEQDLDLYVDVENYDDVAVMLKQDSDWILLTPSLQQRLLKFLQDRSA